MQVYIFSALVSVVSLRAWTSVRGLRSQWHYKQRLAIVYYLHLAQVYSYCTPDTGGFGSVPAHTSVFLPTSVSQPLMINHFYENTQP